MSDLISRNEMLRTYQELCMNIACSECSFYFGDVLTGDCLLEKWIHSLPSAEPKELGEIIEKISDIYKKAVSLTYINNPIAWALYQVWKEYDR